MRNNQEEKKKEQRRPHKTHLQGKYLKRENWQNKKNMKAGLRI